MTKPTPTERASNRAETAAYLRSMAQRQIGLAVEFAQQAERFEDRELLDADRGHTFRITVELRGSTIVTGDEHHRDEPGFEPLPHAVEVRAWSLRDALAQATVLPLTAWYDEIVGGPA